MNRHIRCSVSRPVLIAIAVLLFTRAAAAQEDAAPPSNEPTAERCRSPEHRQFDFWIGTWEVRDTAGQVTGHNEIRRVAGGCALYEDWRGVEGGGGVSINTYDAERGLWTQRWVGVGATLWLEGGLENGAMVLAGTSPRRTPRGAVLDRITWTPLADGRVRQVWDLSFDSGETWTRSFIGFYTTAASPTP